jgi:quinoprotein dehydrogenase-associated probable ABC transporter substrate-binding protein
LGLDAMMWNRTAIWAPASLTVLAAATAAGDARAGSLRVCADPGNMPFSNNRGEGIENKIAEVLARNLGTWVQYYYRPGIERGMTRTTLYADECDVMFDMPADTERVLVTTPLYRTTFVLASRSDRGISIKNLDDPRLKTLKVGVYQTSAIREALADHDVRNLSIHYLSHDGDLVAEDQPAYQVQQVVDGKIDIAAVWGPFAGYYQAMKHAPIALQPVNLMEDAVPLEFDMAVAVRTSDKDLQAQLDRALHAERDAIRSILTEFGVPLVRCDTCLVSGDLPSHGPYAAPQRASQTVSRSPTVSVAQLNDWLAAGANLNVELNNAVLAGDPVRIAYLLDKKHAPIDAQDLQGETALHIAIRQKSESLVRYLLERGAGVAVPDRDGWTPLMTAAWINEGSIVTLLTKHHADPNAASADNLTPLGIALQGGKDAATVALIEAGADVNRPVGAAGYTPLMLAVARQSTIAAQVVLKRGADVNAHNQGGITALMIAAAADQPELVALLVQAGANVAAQSETGETALSIARAKDYQAVMKLLQQPPPPTS